MVRILSMIKKEFIQVLRDRKMLGMLLLIPIAPHINYENGKTLFFNLSFKIF